MSNHTHFLEHVNHTLRIFLKFSPVVGMIEKWKFWKNYPFTPSFSEYMAFLENGKLAQGKFFKY